MDLKLLQQISSGGAQLILLFCLTALAVYHTRTVKAYRSEAERLLDKFEKLHENRLNDIKEFADSSAKLVEKYNQGIEKIVLIINVLKDHIKNSNA